MIGVAARPLGRSSRLRGGGLGSILRIHVIQFEQQPPFCTILVAEWPELERHGSRKRGDYRIALRTVCATQVVIEGIEESHR